MTLLATRPQTVPVHIIRLVTDMAVTGFHFERRCQVALFARRNGVQAKQRKPGHVMLETYLSGPTIFIMTFLTVFPFLAPVDIIRAVTAETPGCKFFLVNFPFMAG